MLQPGIVLFEHEQRDVARDGDPTVAAILAAALFCFEPPDTGPAPDSYVCQSYVRRMTEAWCVNPAGPWRCQVIGPPEDVECGVVGHLASAAYDPLPGELLVIWIRSMLNGVASPVCTDGPECGVELVEEGTPCL